MGGYGRRQKNILFKIEKLQIAQNENILLLLVDFAPLDYSDQGLHQEDLRRRATAEARVQKGRRLPSLQLLFLLVLGWRVR